MFFLNKRLVSYMAVLSVILVVFIFGTALGAKYALIREMQLHEEVLVRNLPILAACKTHHCNEIFQQILIHENDTAFQQYALLEKESTNAMHLSFWYATWPIVFSLYSDPKSITPSDQLREYYKKIGCGLNGLICQTKQHDKGPSSK